MHSEPDFVLRTLRIAIPESQNAIALTGQPVGALLVMFDLIGLAVLGAVNFDNKLSGMGNEVEDVAAKRNLTSPV